MRLVIALMAVSLTGCGTKVGYALGDMGYVHKPRCEKPAKEWIADDYAPIHMPSRKRVGGRMMRGGIQKVDGHWHYYCGA